MENEPQFAQVSLSEARPPVSTCLAFSDEIQVSEGNADRHRGRLVTRRALDLRHHPVYARHGFTVSASQLSALAEQGDLAFCEPLVVTREGAIIDGYARWELARLDGRLSLWCIEYDLSEEEALKWLVQRHRRTAGMNAFCRILLALELEPWFQQKAKLNQRAGGLEKGSSNLTEADKLEVRSEIAAIAAVSVAVRNNFQRMIDCGTPALGAEIYASANEVKKVYHTCKSRSCPSCGHKATLLWQRDQWTQLPDVPYAGVTLTMPDILWPFFRRNRHLLHDLPALGGEVLKQYMLQRHGVRALILVVPHTFGRHLNFNTHLHILVSAGGLKEYECRWVAPVVLDCDVLREAWRNAVVEYLLRALGAGVLLSKQSRYSLQGLFTRQGKRRWMIHVDPIKSKTHFLQYAARYVRRPPIAEHRFTEISDHEIVFWTKDSKLKRRVRTRYQVKDFIASLADHVHDRYRGAIRYFGLLAPSSRRRSSGTLLLLLGQPRRTRPRRLRWAESIERYFGRNPLVDSAGEVMTYVRRQAPVWPGES